MEFIYKRLIYQGLIGKIYIQTIFQFIKLIIKYIMCVILLMAKKLLDVVKKDGFGFGINNQGN